MYARVLVPVDGSDPSDCAVTEALSLADAFESTLVFLYAIDVDSVPADTYTADLVERLHEYGRTVVDAAADRAREAGVAAETVVTEGAPNRVIVSAAVAHDVDLVVMGTHGRTGIEHVLLGSVAERVVRKAPVPVLTVHTDDEE